MLSMFKWSSRPCLGGPIQRPHCFCVCSLRVCRPARLPMLRGCRSEQAKQEYKKITMHPSFDVAKRARTMLEGFQVALPCSATPDNDVKQPDAMCAYEDGSAAVFEAEFDISIVRPYWCYHISFFWLTIFIGIQRIANNQQLYLVRSRTHVHVTCIAVVGLPRILQHLGCFENYETRTQCLCGSHLSTYIRNILGIYDWLLSYS